MADEEVKKEVEVSLVWGGTGETKKAVVKTRETAGFVFELVYDRFKQTPKPEDTFEVDGKNFPRADFGKTVEQLLKEFGEKLTFEVTPPGSGA
jgi:hypothetical protein